MAASSAQQKYDVFISFRGEDTRDSFTSHLYAALCSRKVLTFMDCKITRGKEIFPSIMTAIQESKLSVIVFSQNYASSEWCLNELSKILECKRMNGLVVVPVFYGIDPSHVRNQKGSFADAFRRHELLSKEHSEKVRRWRQYLEEAAGLSGWNSQYIRPESEFIKKIVEDILIKLNRTSPVQFSGLVGIESRVQEIESLLCFKSSDIRIVGIWGMGGVGKTTIADAVFNCFLYQFEGFCFLANVGAKLRRHSVHDLRNRLLSNLLADHCRNIGSPMELLRKKVLVVLDDVDGSSRQLKELLAGTPDNLFGAGSRILVTSRDRQVLKNVADAIYEVKELNHQESLQLFCLNAFRKNYPPSDFMKLSNRVARYAKGNPLALKVLGSSLFDRSKEDWVSAMERLGKVPNPEIQNVLRTSYDALDDEQQRILLDIAFFFRGANRVRASKILDVSYSSVHYNISTLIDKSLLNASANKLELHDLVQEMCSAIVREESVIQHRSRLQNPEDVYYVLTKRKGTEATEGICLDISKARRMQLESDSFKGMDRLRFLKFYRDDTNRKCGDAIQLPPCGLRYLSDVLSYFHWEEFPSKCLPANFCPEKLVEINLACSKVQWLWRGKQCLRNLRRIDLSGAQYLTELPDLSETRRMESINLRGCRRLTRLPSSVQCLTKLEHLNLADCRNIRTLPIMTKLKSLQTLHLTNCSKLESLPEVWEPIALRTLHLSGCRNLKSLPHSISNLKSLERLFLDGTAITELPSSIGGLKSLVYLDMRNCYAREIPTSLSSLSSLEVLDLARNNFEKLPANLEDFCQLHWLNISYCKRLHSLPKLPKSLKALRATDCDSLKTLSTSRGSNLWDFNFANCFKLDQTACGIVMTDTLLNSEFSENYSSRSIFPGSEIPGWLVCQSMGSSVTLCLPSNCGDFSRFCFCVVFALEEPGTLGFICRCHFKAGNGFSCYMPLDLHSIKSDHVLLWNYSYKYRETDCFSTSKGQELCFEFSSYKLSATGNSCGVKKCGVGILPSGMGSEKFASHQDGFPGMNMSSKRCRDDSWHYDPDHMGSEDLHLKRSRG